MMTECPLVATTSHSWQNAVLIFSTNGFVAGAAKPGDTGVLKEALTDKQIAVIEDESIISMDLEFAIEDYGGKIAGTAASLTEAIKLAQTGSIDGAIIDIDLNGEESFEAARLLVEQNVPIVFHTGHGLRADLAQRFPGAPVCLKPMDPVRVLTALCDRIKQIASLS